MKKVERLELENLVMKNLLDCIAEKLDNLDCLENDDKYIECAGRIKGCMEDLDITIKNALQNKYTLDFRNCIPDNEIVRLFPGGKKTVFVTTL